MSRDAGSGADATPPQASGRRFAAAIPNAPPALVRLRADVRRFLGGQALDEPAVHAVDLVLEELVGNTLRYGFEDDALHSIDVDVDVGPAAVVVRLRDDARPFDPTRHPEPGQAACISEAPVGGRGISMVRAAVRAMRYRREGAWNSLEVEIARRPAGESRREG